MSEINIKERSPEEKINYLITQFALQKVNQKKDHDDIRTLDKAVFGLDDISRIVTLEKNFHGIVVKGPGCPNWLINLEKKLEKDIEQWNQDKKMNMKLEERIEKLEKTKEMQYSNPVTYKDKYIPTRFEKWQTEQMNKDYLIFKESIINQISELKEEVEWNKKCIFDWLLNSKKNTEVLRELGKELKELIWLAEKEDWTSKELSPLRMKVIETLKKLDGEKSVVRTLSGTSATLGQSASDSIPSKYLNPQLQCNGECYSCDDNIPPHGNVPNQCGRQQLKDSEKELPKRETAFYEASHGINGKPNVADSKLSKCEFCGRDLILYKNKWICGHGCKKPAIKPSYTWKCATCGVNYEFFVPPITSIPFKCNNCKAFDYDKTGMCPREMEKKDNEIRKKLISDLKKIDVGKYAQEIELLNNLIYILNRHFKIETTHYNRIFIGMELKDGTHMHKDIFCRELLNP